MLKKSSATLREKKLKSGDISLYLDIYNEGKRSYEFLNIVLSCKTNSDSRVKNKENRLIAEVRRNERESELNSGSFEIKTKYQRNKSFMDYFKLYKDGYKKKNYRVINAIYKEFKRFIDADDISFGKLTPALMLRFKEHLERKYDGETPSCYFSKFKRVIRLAITDNYFTTDPTFGLTIKRNTSIKKEVLTMSEIKLLARTECGNDEVKRAFLFTCNSGLRYCDVKELTYENIKDGKIEFTQSKTGGKVSIPISATLKSLLGNHKNLHHVFDLPSHNAANKVLETWVKKAGIKKKITYHSGRHSFGTNLIFYGNDVLVTSELLGHSDLRQTQNYVRIAQSQKRKAMNKLPELKLA